MILNKSSMERGLAHGTIVKCENVNLRVRPVIHALAHIRLEHAEFIAWRSCRDLLKHCTGCALKCSGVY